MNIKYFLDKRLQDIARKIPEIDFQIRFLPEYNAWVIEVNPLKEFFEDERYIAMEKKLLSDFNKKFFPVTLYFSSDKLQLSREIDNTTL